MSEFIAHKRQYVLIRKKLYVLYFFLMKTLANRAEIDASILEKNQKGASLLLFRKYAIDSFYC